MCLVNMLYSPMCFLDTCEFQTKECDSPLVSRTYLYSCGVTADWMDWPGKNSGETDELES